MASIPGPQRRENKILLRTTMKHRMLEVAWFQSCREKFVNTEAFKPMKLENVAYNETFKSPLNIHDY